ncbi:Rxlr effector candidate protein, partial [Globisporangium splendens]
MAAMTTDADANPPMCIECEDTEAGVRCDTCEDFYCVLCFDAQHHAGSRLRHIKTLLQGSSTNAATLAAIQTSQAPAISSATSSAVAAPQADADAAVDAVHETAAALAVDDTAAADAMDAEQDHDSDDDEVMPLVDDESALIRDAAFIPMRLTDDERSLFNLLDASLNVSEYTDKVDVLSYQSPAKRVIHELQETFSILSGMLVANDFRKGKRLVQDKRFVENDEFFQQVFEIGRRYKIMNPERMRNNYGKMIYLLQDANLREIKNYLGFSCVAPVNTVASFLKKRHALRLLKDTRCYTATSVASDEHDPQTLETFARDKQRAIEELVRDYASASLSADDIRLCLASIADSQSYLVSNRSPIVRMIEYLQEFFQPDKIDPKFSLEIRAGKNGARLSHSHASQYEYVLQSLLLWKNITTSMLRLWWAVEEDLLSGGMYRLRDTGQGLNRVQHAPKTSHLVHSILHQTQKSRDRWVGSSVVHLGDHNVPNALMFIDKYTQISRILSPIVNTIKEIPTLANHSDTCAYIEDTFGGAAVLQRVILCDFFRHGFDGSGADNFFDAGSCIDGRLTSAWNWCSKIEKKPYFHVFLMAGFVGFDGHFEK